MTSSEFKSKRRSNFVTAVCLSLAPLAVSVGIAKAAEQISAGCTVRIDNTEVMGPTCEIERLDETSFIIRSPTSDHFIYLYTDAVFTDAATRSASGFWNGWTAASHAHEPLPDMAFDGACWVGGSTSICFRD